MPNKKREIFSFDEFRLDVAEARLTFRKQPVTLAAKTFSLLLFLLRRAGKLVDKEELRSALWPDAVVEDANLTVNMSALRKALAAHSDKQFIETVPKRGYRFIADVVTEVIEVATGPVTPDLSKAKPEPNGRRWVWTALGAAILIATLFLTLGLRQDYKPKEPGLVPGPPSVAILPFQVLTAANEQDRHLGLAFTDALITRLTMVPSLNVRTLQQVRQFDAAATDATGAARTLRVDWIVTGTLLRADKNLRVSVQLFRATNSKTVWAEQFDQPFAGFFKTQDAISEKVAATLVPHLSSGEQATLAKQHTANPEAFRLYTQGRIEMHRFTGDSYKEARALFERAIAEDPNYTLPYVSLVDVLVTSWFREPQNRDDLSRRVHDCLVQLSKIAPGMPELHMASGWVKQLIDWDWAGAETDYKQALAANPNVADAHNSYGHLLETMGRFQEAVEQYQQGFHLNPVGEGYGMRLAMGLYGSRRFTEALALANAVRNENPSATYQGTVAYLRALCLLRLGRKAEAVAEVDQLLKQFGSRRAASLLAHLYAAIGKRDDALALLAGAKPAESGAYSLALAQTVLGNKDEAFRLLNLAIDRKEAAMLPLKAGLDYEPLRNDPRFQALLVKLRLDFQQ